MGHTPSQPDIVGASAPGNMILMGEYAVLEGARAVMMTLRHRLHVTLSPAQDFSVTSDIYGTYRDLGLRNWLRAWGAWGRKPGPKPQHVHLCRNVMTAFFSHYSLVPEVFAVSIHSEIPPHYGFGSSAALTAALVRALHRACHREEDFTQMFRIGHRAILDTFRRGSGADLAAALSDMRFLVFDPVQEKVAPFSLPFAVQAVYTGYKTPTPEVLKQVRRAVPETEWKDITRQMTACTETFIDAPNAEKILRYQGLMGQLGVTCDATRRALDAFAARGVPAKISGAGRGDCVVGFTAAPCVVEVAPPLKFLPAQDLRP